VERHQQFRQGNGLPFSLVADPDQRITKLYDVRRRFGLGTSRVTYVIDKAGIIRSLLHNELRMRSHVSHVRQVLKVLQGF